MSTEVINHPVKKFKVVLIDESGAPIAEQVHHSVLSSLVSIGEGLVLPAEITNLAEVIEKLNRTIDLTLNLNKIVSCPPDPIAIPGIAPADAFDAGDCFGTIFIIDVPKAGIIYSATLFDRDDEGTQVDFEIFKDGIAQIASDAAWAPSDANIQKFVHELSFVDPDDHINNQTFKLTNIGVAYTSPSGKFYIQAVTRSTPNIASGSEPMLQMEIISLDPAWGA